MVVLDLDLLGSISGPKHYQIGQKWVPKKNPSAPKRIPKASPGLAIGCIVEREVRETERYIEIKRERQTRKRQREFERDGKRDIRIEREL